MTLLKEVGLYGGLDAIEYIVLLELKRFLN